MPRNLAHTAGLVLFSLAITLTLLAIWVNESELSTREKFWQQIAVGIAFFLTLASLVLSLRQKVIGPGGDTIARWRSPSLFTLLFGWALILGQLTGLGPGYVGSRRLIYRAVCSKNLRKLGVALLTYSKQHESFPPAALVGVDGAPKHSWRALIASFVDGYDDLSGYDFDVSWNEEPNQALALHRRLDLCCLARPWRDSAESSSAATDYVAVVGPGFMFDGAKATKPKEITDGLAQTVALVEIRDSQIAWSEPRDLTWDEFVARFREKRVSYHRPGFHLLMADASVRFIEYGTLDERQLHALFTIAAGD